VFESVRLQPNNYKLKKPLDFETLLSSNLTSKSLAVGLSRHLLLLMLISYASIGIVFSSYTADNMVETIFGVTFGLQLIPEAKVI
jgi:hypothetical protein